MRVLIWITEGTWEGCIDAARPIAPADSDITILHVTPADMSGAAHAAYAGMLGRSGSDIDPGETLARAASDASAGLLAAAAERLGRPATPTARIGRIEREVVDAAAGADLLVVARDGDDARLGPKSLGPPTRFVVDHAPCPVLLVWPRRTPDVGSIPPPPHRRPDHPPRHRAH